jgi:hypothetical protein
VYNSNLRVLDWRRRRRRRRSRRRKWCGIVWRRSPNSALMVKRKF